MEALPRALRVYHDRVGESGYSPYQLLFGRERGLGGLPHDPARLSEDARNFVQRMAQLDQLVAEKMNEIHAKQAQYGSKGQVEKQGYRGGDMVWVLRPRHLAGRKMDTWWLGTCRVDERVG